MNKLPTNMIVAHVKRRYTKKDMVLAGTHTYFNPKYAHLKSLQASIICRILKKYTQTITATDNIPILMGGDLNALPNILHDTGFDPFFFPVLSNDEPKNANSIKKKDNLASNLDDISCKTIVD
jgi:hypothetical protein